MNLQQKILKYGVENYIFIGKFKPLNTIFGISYTNSSDEEITMAARIDEKRYKIKDNYKITLKPIHKGFAKEHFYISDLETLIKRGSIEIYYKTK